MPNRDVKPLGPKQWKQLTTALKKGPTKEQRKFVKQAMLMFMFHYDEQVDKLNKSAEDLAQFADKKPKHKKKLAEFSREVEQMASRLESIGKQARDIQFEKK